jgi:hypothetical protein
MIHKFIKFNKFMKNFMIKHCKNNYKMLLKIKQNKYLNHMLICNHNNTYYLMDF